MSSEIPGGGGDVFGLRPYGEAIKIATQAAADGAGAFLGRICLPAAEEYGLYLRDKVSQWRRGNSIAILSRAEELINARDNTADLHGQPRIVYEIIDKGSWSDDTLIQNMWAGLLASACDESGRDDSNLMFVDILGRLTSAQAALVEHAASTCIVMKSKAGWLACGESVISLDEIKAVTGLSDLHTIDRELDHLVTLGVFADHSGLQLDSAIAKVRPTTMGLQLYARSRGYRGSPEEFFRSRMVPWNERLLPQIIIDGGDLDSWDDK